EYFGVALADACHQAGPVEAHEASLYNIKTFFGWVSDTANFVDTFQKESESLKETKLAESA
ncbi:MAG TPA: pyrimidine utilization protein B, partial [Acinetobacter radioresistens]|nr:pyrimidine utilization protein B [Acinetobacter radioresistens]